MIKQERVKYTLCISLYIIKRFRRRRQGRRCVKNRGGGGGGGGGGGVESELFELLEVPLRLDYSKSPKAGLF